MVQPLSEEIIKVMLKKSIRNRRKVSMPNFPLREKSRIKNSAISFLQNKYKTEYTHGHTYAEKKQLLKMIYQNTNSTHL